LSADPLTEGEIDVLRLVAQGHTIHEIAQTLVISERTVGNQIHNILGKPHLANRTQAALYASPLFRQCLFLTSHYRHSLVDDSSLCKP
jgi:DNA-binding NarL/FixJ family response regulator